METVTWTVHFALKYTVCKKIEQKIYSASKHKHISKNAKCSLTSTHRAAFSGHVDEVDAGR